MKKCPHCAEEIQDAALVCRYCGGDPHGVPGHIPQRTQRQPVVVVAPAQQASPGVAAVLSFFIPGLGQLYKGQGLRGVGFFICTAIGLVTFIIPGLIVWVINIVDAATAPPATAGSRFGKAVALRCVRCGHRNQIGPSHCEKCGNALRGAGSQALSA